MKHDPDPAVLGSNAMIATTATRIRAAVIRTGSTPDQEAPVAVLRQQQAATQPLPPVLIMDQAGGMGKTRAQVETVRDGQTQLVAQIPHAGVAGPTRFTPANFRMSSDGRSCTCPRGVTSHRAYVHSQGEGVSFRFYGADCRDCPFWEACHGPRSPPNSQRAVYLTPYHTHLRLAATFNATTEGQGLLRCRWQVEPTIAWLVRYNGCRQARRVGLAAAQCQLFQACAVRNLQLWLGRLDRGHAPLPATVPATGRNDRVEAALAAERPCGGSAGRGTGWPPAVRTLHVQRPPGCAPLRWPRPQRSRPTGRTLGSAPRAKNAPNCGEGPCDPYSATLSWVRIERGWRSGAH